MLFCIAVSANNERGPQYMEKALAAIHQAHVGHQPIRLLYGSIAGQIGLLLHCHHARRDVVLGPILSNYPQCSITPVETENRSLDWQTWSTDLELVPELLVRRTR